jgi:recombinational DNA repair protein RecR
MNDTEEKIEREYPIDPLALKKYNICKRCSHLQENNVCDQCGCNIIQQVNGEFSSCPISKW